MLVDYKIGLKGFLFQRSTSSLDLDPLMRKIPLMQHTQINKLLKLVKSGTRCKFQRLKGPLTLDLRQRGISLMNLHTEKLEVTCMMTNMLK